MASRDGGGSRLGGQYFSAHCLNSWESRVLILQWYRPTDTFNAACALLIFGSVVTILAVFDGQPNPQFQYGITLNALISVLATVGTFTIMIPCSDALGQLKWNWFMKGRPLLDFHLIDNASRGPMGSLVLIAKLRGGSMSLRPPLFHFNAI